MDQGIAGIFVFEYAVRLTANRTLVFLRVPIDYGAGWFFVMVAVGVFPGWCRLRKVQTRSRPAVSRFEHQYCLRRTRDKKRTFALHQLALSSPNVSRSMYTAESSDKEQTYALAVCNISTVCFERAFRRGPLHCCSVFIPTCVLQSAATPRD